VATETELGSYSPPSPVTALAFSPTQDAVLVGASGIQVMRWSVSNGDLVDPTPFEFSYGQVSSLAFDRKGEKLAGGYEDGSIVLWNANGELAWNPDIENGSDTVRSLTFSPDGRYVASGTEEGKVTIWDTEDQEQIGVVAAVEAPVVAVSWLASEPETLVVVDRTGSIHLVETNLDIWGSRACQVAARVFSTAEARLYFGTESSEICRDLLGDMGIESPSLSLALFVATRTRPHGRRNAHPDARGAFTWLNKGRNQAFPGSSQTNGMLQ
jgi:hypothetical protein